VSATYYQIVPCWEKQPHRPHREGNYKCPGIWPKDVPTIDMPESVFPATPGAANVALDDDRHWQRYIDGNHCAECAKYVDEGDAAW
jgi:hypothetical protein